MFEIWLKPPKNKHWIQIFNETSWSSTWIEQFGNHRNLIHSPRTALDWDSRNIISHNYSLIIIPLVNGLLIGGHQQPQQLEKRCINIPSISEANSKQTNEIHHQLFTITQANDYIEADQ